MTAATAAATTRATGTRPPTIIAAATETRPAAAPAPPHPALAALLVALYAVVGAVPAGPVWAPPTGADDPR